MKTLWLSALEDHAEFYCYGFLSGKPMNVAGKDLIFRQKRVQGLWVSQVEQLGYYKLWTMTSELVSLLNTDLSTEVRATFPLDQVVDALVLYTKQLSGGKVQLMIGSAEADKV
jgi:hypothetical protein